MPLFSHSHRPSPCLPTSYSSKPLKPQKLNSAPPSSRLPCPFSSFHSSASFSALPAQSSPSPLSAAPDPCPSSDAADPKTLSGHSTRPPVLGSSEIMGGMVERPKVIGFVGIQTGFGSADRRAALRSTWFPSDPDGLLRLEQATGLAFRFVIGLSKNAKKMAELHEEVEKYRDFMLIDVVEEYSKLPYKSLAFFKAAFELFEADYYVKADDDIYLRPDRLSTLLAKERTHSPTYIGCMKKGPVITDPKNKWYEKSGHLIGNEYFLHAYGPIYVLSAEVVASLAAARNNSLRILSNEDVTIGSWMLAMNVHHEDNKAICDPRCTPTSIAVWDIPKCSGLCDPATRLKELHEISMCSKSPTLPPDDR